MALSLTAADLPRLATGAAFCGSGGGGSVRLTELLVKPAFARGVTAYLPRELPPETPCFAPAFAGSTLLLSERLPGIDVFGPLIAVAERWINARLEAVCAFEAGGTNGLTPLLFANERTIVDADCSGRAVPTVDRTSLYVDRLPHVFAVCSTGSGVALVQSPCADDVDQLMRASMIRAGGAGAVLFAGFTTGELEDHSIHGHLTRSIQIGQVFASAEHESVETLAERLGATLLGHGRVQSLTQDGADPHTTSAEISGADGTVLRLVSRSEHLAVLADGLPIVSAPDHIVAIDARSHELLEVSDIELNRHVALLTQAADGWWRNHPERASQLFPSSYGLEGLDPEW